MAYPQPCYAMWWANREQVQYVWNINKSKKLPRLSAALQSHNLSRLRIQHRSLIIPQSTLTYTWRCPHIFRMIGSLGSHEWGRREEISVNGERAERRKKRRRREGKTLFFHKHRLQSSVLWASNEETWAKSGELEAWAMREKKAKRDGWRKYYAEEKSGIA